MKSQNSSSEESLTVSEVIESGVGNRKITSAPISTVTGIVRNIGLPPFPHPHQLLEQQRQRRAGITMDARVHGRHLDDRAARRDEPVEARALGKLADRARFRAAAADAGNGVEVTLHQLQIEGRLEGQETLAMQLDARVEECGGRAEEDHASV